jgi:hypothetical protein
MGPDFAGQSFLATPLFRVGNFRLRVVIQKKA